MSQQNNLLDRMRIAAPCHVGWENMAGDEKVRFCEQCSLHVYNISEMTNEQVTSLVTKTEGRICARLYRRADGTVLTRDCPVGLRALRKRVSRRAGAVLTAILGLCSGLMGQTKPQEGKTCTRIVALKMKKSIVKDEQGIFSGVILDEMGALIPDAKITLTNERSKKQLTATSDADGKFKISGLTTARYTLEIEAVRFKTYRQKHLELNAKEVVQVNATLLFSDATATVTVGVLVYDPEIESSNGTIRITGEYLKKLPLP